MVLPGLLASDGSTFPLRAHLRGLGYEVHGWERGRNLGSRSRAEDALERRLEELASGGRKVSLVGQSLGGVFARVLASRRPELVRQVVTLGSPVAGHPRSNNAWRLYEWLNKGSEEGDARLWAEAVALPKVPATSLCSRTDGIVDWSSSRSVEGPFCENVPIFASHMGMAAHPCVLAALSDRLAQPEGQWRPFAPAGWTRLMFPSKAALPS